MYTSTHSEDEAALPVYMPTYIHPQQDITVNSHDAGVQVWPLPDMGGLIITVNPPQAPQNKNKPHVSCDIVLVIDVSGSMSSEARIPGSSDQESTGLSILDLVKHACRTILSTLDEGDRLAIVTFSNSAIEVQKLTVMTEINKKRTEENIEKMCVQGATNLWAGLRKGIECLSNAQNTNAVPAIMLLTDGLPNHMCPPGGYVPALRTMGRIVPTIHTFGFGFELRSGLLKSIAEVGRGNFSFIPDAGMIGTVFIHAVAHLQSTFATNAVLELVYQNHISIQQTAGSSVDQQQPEHIDGSLSNRLTISLGNIQYGQSRDIFLGWTSQIQKRDDMDAETIQVTLGYDLGTETRCTRPCLRRFKALDTPLTPAKIAYHISRHKVVAFLSSLFPIDAVGEHRSCIQPAPKAKQLVSTMAIGKDDIKKKSPEKSENTKDEYPERGQGVHGEALRQKQEELRDLITKFPAAEFPIDSQCVSLVQDLNGPEPYGQISLALSKQEYFERWGQHYLLSIHGAHARQLCNSFKDPGPLKYGMDSALFINCRNALDKAFNELEPPTASILPVFEQYQQESRRFRPGTMNPAGAGGIEPDGGDLLRSQAYATMHDGRVFKPTVSMRDWNNASNPCFAARTLITLANGSKVRISALKGGMSVITPMGPRQVVAVVVTRVRKAPMIKLEGVLVTPWHPIAMSNGEHRGGNSNGWVFPCYASQERARYTGCIYSLLLQGDESPDTHAVMLGSDLDSVVFWGVTLGHGILGGSDPRAHRFFGDYDRVVRSLSRLQTRKDGKIVTSGTKRSIRTNLVCGFKIRMAKTHIQGAVSKRRTLGSGRKSGGSRISARSSIRRCGG